MAGPLLNKSVNFGCSRSVSITFVVALSTWLISYEGLILSTIDLIS